MLCEQPATWDSAYSIGVRIILVDKPGIWMYYISVTGLAVKQSTVAGASLLWCLWWKCGLLSEDGKAAEEEVDRVGEFFQLCGLPATSHHYPAVTSLVLMPIIMISYLVLRTILYPISKNKPKS